METALIVSSTDAGIKALFGLLKDLHLSDVQFAMNSGEARRRLAGQSYDLAVINTPLRDEFGNDLACRIAETTLAGVVLLVKAEHAAQIDAKVAAIRCICSGKAGQSQHVSIYGADDGCHGTPSAAAQAGK